MKFYICPVISTCFPYETKTTVATCLPSANYGVLERYIGKYFTREEIDRIICEMVMHHPYVPHGMDLDIRIMWDDGKYQGQYQILSFKNFAYDKQQRLDLVIRYEK